MSETRFFSDYIVYVDESGDHGMQSIDPGYPIFVLAFGIFKKSDYSSISTPAVMDLKFKTFGHDMVVLYESDIRKKCGPFARMNGNVRQLFVEDLTRIIEQSVFTIIAIVIDKTKHFQKYENPANPYHLAMEYGLERIYRFLNHDNQAGKRTAVIFESRGQKEDLQLEVEFRRVCDGDNYFKKHLSFDIILANKKVNSTGLQLADMIARPIGLSVLRPNQKNQAMEVIKEKLYCNSFGEYKGFGLKCFP